VKALIFAVLITPSLVLLVSLAGRRWGPVVGGRLAALPLTSGPLVLVAAVGGQTGMARSMAEGGLAGLPMVVVFCAGYRYVAARRSWWVALVVAGSATVTTAGVLSVVSLPVWASPVVICAAVIAAMTRRAPVSDRRATTSGWELVLRMGLAAVLVGTLSVLSHVADPRLAGVLATFPALMFILAPMAHRRDGATAAIELVHGLIVGLLPTLLFFTVISTFAR
jgi:hypothetical protein